MLWNGKDAWQRLGAVRSEDTREGSPSVCGYVVLSTRPASVVEGDSTGFAPFAESSVLQTWSCAVTTCGEARSVPPARVRWHILAAPLTRDRVPDTLIRPHTAQLQRDLGACAHLGVAHTGDRSIQSRSSIEVSSELPPRTLGSLWREPQSRIRTLRILLEQTPRV